MIKVAICDDDIQFIYKLEQSIFRFAEMKRIKVDVARFKWLYGDLKLMFKDDYDDKESMKTVQCIMRQTGTIGIKSLESKKDKIFASLCIADLNLAKTMYKILNRSK